MMKQEELEKDMRSLGFQHYINSTEVLNVGGHSLLLEDVIKATLISPLNVLLVGETGEGKTQLEKDVFGLFGNKGLFILGRDDMKIRDLFQKINLEAFHSGTAKTSEELVELTDAVKYNIAVVDELTRCIPEVQNQLFNLFDGYIEINGQIYQLGEGEFNVGIASGNIGDGRYIGASDSDRALLDRLHLIIDVDNFLTTPHDTMRILTGKRDPRVQEAEPRDATGTILKLNRYLFPAKEKIVPQGGGWALLSNEGEEVLGTYNTKKEAEDELAEIRLARKMSGEDPSQLSPLLVLAAMHLVHGLDYMDGVPGNSKRKIKNVWPNVPNSQALSGGDELLIFPISKRAAITYLTLTEALGLVAQGHGVAREDIDYLKLFFDVFRLAGAYSGILNPTRVNQVPFYGNPYECMKSVVDGIETEFNGKLKTFESGISYARKGKTKKSVTDELDGKFLYVRDFLEDLADDADTKG